MKINSYNISKDAIKQSLTIKTILKTFSILLPFILKRWPAYFVLLILLFLDIALTIAFAWFFGNITDAAIHGNLQRLKWLIPIGICFILLNIACKFIRTYASTIAHNGVKKDLQNHLYNHLLRLPMEKTTNLQSGKIISHFTSDIHYVDDIIGSNLINLIRLPLIFITVLLYLLHINWMLCLISLGVAPIAAISGAVFGLFLRRNSRKINALYDSLNNMLNETFHGFQVIRSFTMESMMFRKYITQNDKLYKLELSNAKLSGWFYSAGQLVCSVIYIVSLCLGAYYVLKGEMKVGSLLIFVNLVNHLVYPLTGLASQWAGFQRSVTSMERLLKILEGPFDSKELSDFTLSKNVSKSIQFQQVTFSYNEGKKIFDQLNLEIPAGKVIAFVGPSGAGKTTLFHLIQGFYIPQNGQILIDGIPMNDFSISEIRSSIAHVPQETFLFGGTIRENLLIARPNISESNMCQAAKNANIHDFIMTLTDGYDTYIGERGIKLSGGQKQRIAIARAILKDAPILLLDEATSALDTETESLVKAALDQLMEGRTTLVIAHRLSTVHNADLIVVLKDGDIVQMGNHNQLINRPGLYQQLYQSQFQKNNRASLSFV
ncbi:MAG: ABC transporter ATP-binding protein [Heyndrickxia sp.]